MESKKKPFTMVNNSFIMCKNLTAHQKLTFIVLNKFKDKNNKCHPSEKTLASAVGCTERTIIKAIKALVDLRLISKSKMPGSNVNEYTILSDGEFPSYINEADSLSDEKNSPAQVNEIQEVSEAGSDNQEPLNNNHIINNQSINQVGMNEMEAYRELIRASLKSPIFLYECFN